MSLMHLRPWRLQCIPGADAESCRGGLDAFSGAHRRFELLGKYKGVTFVDDYAHHPAELKVTIDAAMEMGYHSVWAGVSRLPIRAHILMVSSQRYSAYPTIAL